MTLPGMRGYFHDVTVLFVFQMGNVVLRRLRPAEISMHGFRTLNAVFFSRQL